MRLRGGWAMSGGSAMRTVVHRRDGEHLQIGSGDGRPITLLVAPDRTGNRHLSMGVQELDPGGLIPLHHHPAAEELLFVYGGRPRIRLDGRMFEVGAETAILFPAGAWHQIEALEGEPLRLTWTFAPPGEEHIFREMARTRTDHEPPPPGPTAREAPPG